MPLDPSIIGSFRPPEVMSPVNAMAQIYQLRALQGESEKNQLAMEKSRREMEREQTVNRLMSAAGGNQQDFLRGLERSNLGSMVPDYKEKFAKADEATYKASKAESEAVEKALVERRDALRYVQTPEDFDLWDQAGFEDPRLVPFFRRTGVTREMTRRTRDNAVANGQFDQLKFESMASLDTLINQAGAGVIFGTTKPGTQAGPPVTGEAVATGPNELRAPAVVTTDSELAGLDAQIYRAQRQGNVPLIKQLTDERNKVLDERKESRPLTREQKTEYGIPPGKIAWFDKQNNLHVEGGVSVNVDASNRTENKYNEKLAGSVADRDVKMQETAAQAVDLAASADRVIDVLQSGKVITGAGAGFRLDVAKALNLIGANNTETIKNTELLGSDLAKQTLASIKSSGLGTGQGFTDKDLKFLERATTGQVSWERETLADLARLARLAAEKSATAWNKRRRKLPKESRDLIDDEDVVIPPAPENKAKSGKPARGGAFAPPPPGAIQYLHQNPNTAKFFDEEYGSGAADKVLKGR